jgi:hypothetical protein
MDAPAELDCSVGAKQGWNGHGANNYFVTLHPSWVGAKSARCFDLQKPPTLAKPVRLVLSNPDACKPCSAPAQNLANYE